MAGEAQSQGAPKQDLSRRPFPTQNRDCQFSPNQKPTPPTSPPPPPPPPWRGSIATWRQTGNRVPWFVPIRLSMCWGEFEVWGDAAGVGVSGWVIFCGNRQGWVFTVVDPGKVGIENRLGIQFFQKGFSLLFETAVYRPCRFIPFLIVPEPNQNLLDPFNQMGIRIANIIHPDPY